MFSTADSAGNMVSWVNSNYASFGSGITVPGYGFVLHNRGALFSLDRRSPKALAPHKRPFNTLSAGFIRRAGAPFMTQGLMGGATQAQGHEQIVIDVVDLGANVQQAGDMARFYHVQVSNRLYVESALNDLVGPPLDALGHHVKSSNRRAMGGYQAIIVTRSGGSA